MATLFVEQLTIIDCSVLDPDAGLVGESFIVDVQLSGPLDAQGMVLDFSAVKKRLKAEIDQLCDHRLLIPLRHGNLLMSETATSLRVQFTDSTGFYWEHESPFLAVCGISAATITPQSLADWLSPRLATVLPDGCALQLQLRYENISGAYYRYSHGLQKHQGACQRIAHGHRSRIEVWCDGARNAEIETQIAARFSDIYLYSHEHCVRELCCGEQSSIELAYRSEEGDYRLIVPVKRAYAMTTETTVEHIAAHLAATLSNAYGRTLMIRAYEGVQKGAVATADPTDVR